MHNVRAHREPSVYDLKWTASEKKIARRVFDEALAIELAVVMAEFKRRAVSASVPEDMWAIREYLVPKERELNEKYDFRYSQLPLVFGRLVREGRVLVSQLHGLGEEKLSYVRRIASL